MEKERERDSYQVDEEAEPQGFLVSTAASKSSRTMEEIMSDFPEIKEQLDKCREEMYHMVDIFAKHEQKKDWLLTPEFLQSLKVLRDLWDYFRNSDVVPPSDLKKSDEYRKTMITTGVLKVFFDVLSHGLQQGDFVTNSHDSTNNKHYQIVDSIIGFLVSKVSSYLPTTVAFIEHASVLPHIVNTLKVGQKPHRDKELTEKQDMLLSKCLGIIISCATVDEYVPKLRELGVIQVVSPYLDSHHDNIRRIALSILACTVNEQEAETYLTRDHTYIFKFLFRALERAMANQQHYDLEAHANVREMTRTLSKLARVDANKKILVSEGCLPLLVEILETKFSPMEEEQALQCLWALSFDAENKQKMVDEKGLVELVWKKYKSPDLDNSTTNTCYGILWSLQHRLLISKSKKQNKIGIEVEKIKSRNLTVNEASSVKQAAAKTQGEVKFEGHVMISYNHGHQEIILEIANELKDRGIPVWIDKGDMKGSIVEAMAKAVEDSFIVIMAMSSMYKDSSNCRAEAEYAFTKKKTIIPLMMQRGYKADGWLGLILGGKLFYDFSGKYPFKTQMESLHKAVMAEVHDESTETKQQQIPTSSKPSQPKRETDVEVVKNWNQEDVKKWLTKYNLQKSSLRRLTGEEIICIIDSLRRPSFSTTTWPHIFVSPYLSWSVLPKPSLTCVRWISQGQILAHHQL